MLAASNPRLNSTNGSQFCSGPWRPERLLMLITLALVWVARGPSQWFRLGSDGLCFRWCLEDFVFVASFGKMEHQTKLEHPQLYSHKSLMIFGVVQDELNP
jgi:hypothetical protein